MQWNVPARGTRARAGGTRPAAARTAAPGPSPRSARPPPREMAVVSRDQDRAASPLPESPLREEPGRAARVRHRERDEVALIRVV